MIGTEMEGMGQLKARMLAVGDKVVCHGIVTMSALNGAIGDVKKVWKFKGEEVADVLFDGGLTCVELRNLAVIPAHEAKSPSRGSAVMLSGLKRQALDGCVGIVQMPCVLIDGSRGFHVFINELQITVQVKVAQCLPLETFVESVLEPYNSKIDALTKEVAELRAQLATT